MKLFLKNVTIVMRNETDKLETKAECNRDRLTFVKISAKPVDTETVKVYVSKAYHDEEETEEKKKVRKD